MEEPRTDTATKTDMIQAAGPSVLSANAFCVKKILKVTAMTPAGVFI